MEGLKRSLLYWGRVMERFFLIMLVTVLGMSVLMEMMERGSGLETASVYIPMIGIIAVMAQSATNMSYNLPQAISFGATRKESLIGMEIFTHAIVVQVLIIMVFCGKYIPNPTEYETTEIFRAYGILLLFTCGAANSVCAATIRFGKKAGTCIYIIYILIIICTAVGIIASGLFAYMKFWLIAFSGWGVIAAIVFDAIMIGCCYKAIQKFEVRV